MRFLGKDPTSEVKDSPTIWDDSDDYVLQGFRITDETRLTEIGDIPAHETILLMRISRVLVQNWRTYPVVFA